MSETTTAAEQLHGAPSTSAQTPVSRVAETVGRRVGKPAGFVALGSGAGGVLVALLSHAVTLHDVAELARAGWREIAIGLLFVVLLIVLRHVHKLQTEWAAVTKMFADAVVSNQRINEAQNEALKQLHEGQARIESTLLQMQTAKG